MKKLFLTVVFLIGGAALAASNLPTSGAVGVGMVNSGTILLDGGNPTVPVNPNVVCICSVQNDAGRPASCDVVSLADGGALVAPGGKAGDTVSYHCF